MKNSILKLLFLILLGSTNSKANVIVLTIDSLNQETQFVSATSCDTIVVLNNSNYTDYFFTDTLSGGVGDFNLQIYPDTVSGVWGNGVSYFFNLNGLSSIAIAHQQHPVYFYINIEVCLPASVFKPLLTSIELFPNPAQSTLFVGTEASDVSLSIMDGQGRNVLSCGVSRQTESVNVDHLENGLYYLKILNNQGIIRYQRFYKIQ